MICGTCHGNGYVRHVGLIRETAAGAVIMDDGRKPCPECNGSGVTSCCEGPVPCDETTGEKK